MDKKLLIAGIAAFILSFLLSFIAHGLLLHDDRVQVANLFRTGDEVMGYFPVMLLSHLVKGFAFAWVYRQGISLGVPWLNQGIRFGIAASFLITVPLYLVYYAVQPFPLTMVAKQIVFDSVINILIAIAVAFVLKPNMEAATL
ncbi:MAG: hypothetical protein ACT4O9_11860 [Blastocatellia bacterium]